MRIRAKMNTSDNMTDPLLIKQQFSYDLQRLIENYVKETGIRITKIDVEWEPVFYKENKDIVKNIYIDCKFRI